MRSILLGAQPPDGCENSIDLPVAELGIGTRHRKDLGDLAGLAASIREVGLLHPIGITPARELVFGLRRFLACRDHLGWQTIPARVVHVASIAQGEYAKNEMRKDYTPSERVAIVETLRGYDHGGDRKSDQARDCDVDRLTVKAASALVGDTKDDFYRAKKVVDRGVPALVEAMDSGRMSVYAASLVAAAAPEDQERVIEKGGKEEVWAARGIKKQLRKAERERGREEARNNKVGVGRPDSPLSLPVPAA